MSYKLGGVIWNDDGTLATKKTSPLKALEDARELIHRLITTGDWDEINNNLNIIEAELKEAEKFKSFRFITVDELVSEHPLNRDQIFFVNKSPAPLIAESFYSAEDENKLKAFDVIKEILDSELTEKLNGNSIKIFKDIFNSLPKEKQDLLKEVLL